MAKIKSIKRRKYVGKVHDITVEGIHAYNIEGLSVHNSAVSSLVLYVLGVIKVDPIKYDLIFERFLNPDRISPPDVDLDFDYDRRPEIIRYFSDKYGDDHCCQIGTCNTIKAKGAVRNVAKVIDVGNDWTGYEKEKKKNPDLKPPKTFKNSLDLGDRFSKMIPNVPSITLDEAYAQEEAFRGAMNRYPKLFDLAKQVEGVHSYSGVHASGLIICKDPVRDHVPLRLSKGVISSQFDGPEVEDLGLLKFDILGLKTLTVVENTVKLIKERHGIDLDVDLLEPDDPKVFKLFYGGYPNMDLRGVFQFESDIMIRLLENMHADRFEDLIVANALNRPGPMRAKINGVPMPNLYCNYKHGKQEVKYLHPKLGEVLKDTYGIMCFHSDQIVYTNSGPKKISDICNHKVNCLESGILRGYKSINGAFKSGIKEVFEYSLSNGDKIKCTNDHPIFDGVKYTSIGELAKCSAAIPYVCGNIKDISTEQLYLKKLYLYGALIGDGNTKACSPILCVGKNKDYGKKVIKLFKDVYGDDARGIMFHATRSWYVRFSFESNRHKFGVNKSNQLKNELKDVGISCLSKHKFIPFKFVKPTRQSYLSLMAGLIDTDGSIQSDIYYSSVSERLLSDVEYMLWRLGYSTYRSHHTVHVYESTDLFNEIKPYLVNKDKVTSPKCNGSNIRLNSKFVSKIIFSKMEDMSMRKFCKKHKLNRGTIRRIVSQQNSWCKKSSVENLLSENEINRCKCVTIDSFKSLGLNEVYDISMPHDDHNFILSSGVIVHNCFQENIMKVAQVLAGFTGGQADTLRKAVGKKKPELLKQQRDLFVDGCIANDIPKDIAIKIFEQIDFFAGYGFNRCLAGDTTVKNKSDGKIYTLEDLADGSYGVDKDNPIVLDSYVDGELVEDELVEVFETGEKEVYGVELDNGMIIKCTLDHKFICADSKKHTVQEIMDEDLEILYEE